MSNRNSSISVMYYQGIYSSQDFVLRSRHNNLFTKKEPIANKNNDQENEKFER
jgi:hypothetical protein